MKVRKATMMLAAVGLAVAPVASNAATSLSVARAAPQLSSASQFQDDEHHNRTAQYLLGGLVLVLLLAAIVIGSNSDPASP